MAAHHDAALLAFILMMLTGFVGWLALWQFRRHGRSAGWTTGAILVLGSAHAGRRRARRQRRRRNPSSRDHAGPGRRSRRLASGSARPPCRIRDHPAVGLAGRRDTAFHRPVAALWRAVRGEPAAPWRVQGVSFAAMHRMLPWGMLGFGVNLVTGMLFFIAAPEQYTANAPFFWKLVCLMVAGADLLYLTVVDKSGRSSRVTTPPCSTRRSPPPPSSRGWGSSTGAACCPSSGTPSDGFRT